MTGILTTLHLSECGIGQQGLLPLITQGLCKQLSHQTLQSLTLWNDKFGNCPDSELVEFFGAVFSLPTFHKFQLNMGDNQFTPHHWNILFTAWKQRSGRKQLSKLECSLGAKIPELKHIAHEIVETEVYCTR